jgi:hypothetical protein
MLSFLRALQRHPLAAVFIVMEIAVVCVVMLNAMHLGAQHADRLRAPRVTVTSMCCGMPHGCVLLRR